MEVFFLAYNGYSLEKDGDIKKYTRSMMTKVFKQINKVKFDGSLNSVAHLSEKFSKKMIKEYGTARVVGNIGSKVHFITFASQIVKFEKSPCNCETVFLSNSNLHVDSEKINSKYLLVDTTSHSNIKRKSDLIKVNQYSLYLINLYTTYNFQVSYESTNWVVKRSSTKNFDSSSYSIDVSYEIADSFSILVYSFYININVDETDLTVYKDVNLTVMD